MKKLIRVMMVALALTGCALNGGYDPTPDLEAGAVASAKADGAFGAEELSLGQRTSGDASGSAFSLYAIALDATDRVRVTVTRTAGDLRPAAYLYRGTEIYVAPDDYQVGDGTVTLEYAIEEGGEHHIVVKAYHGEGAGEFELATECTGGACAGISADPIQRQSDCIEAAAQCAIADLPRWDGRVGEVRARSIFDDCLAGQADPSCASACDGDGAPVCDEIVGQLPALADQDATCHSVLTSCLADCAGIGGYYGPSSLEETAASACWTGYFGNCEEYVWAHEACGGTDYAAGSVAECRARCVATEGAWDEGPWDGCMEPCDELARQHDDFIRSVAREAGEYVDVGSSEAFAYVPYAEVPERIRGAVQAQIETFDEEARASGRVNDHAMVSDENHFTISRDGEVVGYMIGVDYAIDDSLFDGGGQNLYYNLEGELVFDEEWWG